MSEIVDQAQAFLDAMSAWIATHPGSDPIDHYLQTLNAIKDSQVRECVTAIQIQRRSATQASATKRQEKIREATRAFTEAVTSDIAGLSESNNLPIGFPEVLSATRENPTLTLRRLQYAIIHGGVKNGQ